MFSLIFDDIKSFKKDVSTTIKLKCLNFYCTGLLVFILTLCVFLGLVDRLMAHR